MVDMNFLARIKYLFKKSDPERYEKYTKASLDYEAEVIGILGQSNLDEYDEGMVNFVKSLIQDSLGSRMFGLAMVMGGTENRQERMKDPKVKEEIENEEIETGEMMLTIDDSLGVDYISKEAEEYLAEVFGLTRKEAVWRFYTIPIDY